MTICPEGMAPQIQGSKTHPDEAPFCVEITEVPQKKDNQFWAEQAKPIYKPKTIYGRFSLLYFLKQLAPTSKPNKDRQAPTGNNAGDEKPAVSRTWSEARKYCQETYHGGDLPTETQWEVACGDNQYCTASGELSETEAWYGKSWDDGPVYVDAFPANAQGVKNMTGNVAEWTLGDDNGYKIYRGESWHNYHSEYLLAGWRGSNDEPGHRLLSVGFRCVAPLNLP